MVDLATRLADAGVRTVTFNFGYIDRGRKLPDPPATLQSRFREVLALVRSTLRGNKQLFVGGKSLGGRMASHLAADGDGGILGLICLGYPLHPPGKPKKLRTEHLARIKVPVLIVQGSRDPFGAPAELRRHTRVIAGPVTIVPVDQGDHSFKVPRRVRPAEDVMTDVAGAIATWMRAVRSAR
jgi:predicted alpha/beta-hydrolase family hydrolase